jgi:hypothetical protein
MPAVLRIVAVSLLLAATASQAREVPRNSLHGAIVFKQPKPIVGCPGVVKRFDKDKPRVVIRVVNRKTGEIFTHPVLPSC